MNADLLAHARAIVEAREKASKAPWESYNRTYRNTKGGMISIYSHGTCGVGGCAKNVASKSHNGNNDHNVALLDFEFIALCGNHAATIAAECVRLSEECKKLKEALDWQNGPNRNPAGRGGYEFYINEGWTGVRYAAMNEDPDFHATLMKCRYDPDDDRVRIRLVKDDDALLADVAEMLRLAEENERLSNTLKYISARLESLPAHIMRADAACTLSILADKALAGAEDGALNNSPLDKLPQT